MARSKEHIEALCVQDPNLWPGGEGGGCMQPAVVAADLTRLSSDVSEIGALRFEIYFFPEFAAKWSLTPHQTCAHCNPEPTARPPRPAPPSPICHCD